MRGRIALLAPKAFASPALACEMTEDHRRRGTREIKCCRGSCQLPLQLITRYFSLPLRTTGEAAVSDMSLVSGLVSAGP
jgi:hypothetical protein